MFTGYADLPPHPLPFTPIYAQPLCRPSGQSPLQGYQVDLSIVVETIDVNISPMIFPKSGQISDEVRRTRMLQELEADKTLNTPGRGKKWSITSKLDAKAPGLMEGFGKKSSRQRQTSMLSHETPTSTLLRAHHTPHAQSHTPSINPTENDEVDSGDIIARGLIAIAVASFTLNLGQSGVNGPSMQLRTKQFKCEMAQNLQRVDQKLLWDLLSQTDKRGASPPLIARAIGSGALPQGGTVGRVDRIVKDLLVTSWRVSRVAGDSEAPLLRGDKDSLLSMHTNQYVGSSVVEYNFWSKFQQAWSVGNTQDFIALREWLEGFFKEANAGADVSKAAASADQFTKRPPSQGSQTFDEKLVKRQLWGQGGPRERLAGAASQADDTSSHGGLSSSGVRRGQQTAGLKKGDSRIFVPADGGLEFSPLVQVVGESTLPISAIFASLGMDESVVPAGLHTYVGDTLMSLLATTYTSLAPPHVVKTNQSLIAEFSNAHETVVNAFTEASLEEARNMAPTA